MPSSNRFLANLNYFCFGYCFGYYTVRVLLYREGPILFVLVGLFNLLVALALEDN